MNNKRGDIPITILVIGAVLVFGLAFFSFFKAGLGIKESFVGVSLIEQVNAQIEDEMFRGINTEEIYLEKLKTKWTWKGPEKVLFFSVEYTP